MPEKRLKSEMSVLPRKRTIPAGKNGHGLLNIMEKGLIAADKLFRFNTAA